MLRVTLYETPQEPLQPAISMKFGKRSRGAPSEPASQA